MKNKVIAELKKLGIEVKHGMVRKSDIAAALSALATAKYKMSKTYEVVTPESAKEGEVEESGFEYEDNEFDSLWDMAKEIRDNGATMPSHGGPGLKSTWYSTVDSDVDYKTGAETRYSFHPRDLSGDDARKLQLLVLNDEEFNAANPDEDLRP